jgi:hypothetical protein
MNDTKLKEALDKIRHTAIREHLEIDEISLLSVFFNQSKLKEIDSSLTKLALDMLELEDAFDENIKIPGDINTAIMRSAQLSILFSIRSTTNEAIGSAKSSISQIYNNLNFYRSLLIALVALVVSVIGVA